MGYAKADQFKAWIDTMPGSPPRLIVSGKVEVTSGGFKWSLTKATPQGFNPDVIILDLVITPPHGNATTVMTTLEPRFEESPPERQYTQATIREGSDTFTIDVGRTS